MFSWTGGGGVLESGGGEGGLFVNQVVMAGMELRKVPRGSSIGRLGMNACCLKVSRLLSGSVLRCVRWILRLCSAVTVPDIDFEDDGLIYRPRSIVFEGMAILEKGYFATVEDQRRT